MAASRRGRGGGRRGGTTREDLRGTMGSLLRTAIDQVGALRDTVERQARTQRVWIDGALLQRKYREALAQLGEQVYQMAAAGELPDVAGHPELQALLDDIQAIDERLTEAEDRVREATAAARDTAERLAARAGLPTGMLGRPRSRRRAEDDEPRDLGVWRPPVDEEDELDDGTVSAVTPPRPARARPPGRGKGGISFAEEDDSDLDAYMHPDDVPEAKDGGEKK
jgi:hypothetical protein